MLRNYLYYKQKIFVYNIDNGNSNKNVYLLEKIFLFVKEIFLGWKSKYFKYDNGWIF